MVTESNSTVNGVTNSFGLYVHIPFCVHKCSYCDFYSFTQYASGDFDPYVKLVLLEARAAQREFEDRGIRLPKARSVFVGGGTPSLLPPALIERLLSELTELFPLEEGAEVTLEANPETVGPDFARDLFKTQVNRVSLGAQSFQPKYLKALERLGSPESVRRAVSLLVDAGFKRLSVDLIFGIPGQTADELQDDIKEATATGVRHLSFYNLTLKPGHALFKELPSDDLSADLYEAGVRLLEKRGFETYEVSNFSFPGDRSRHNLLYWDGADYLGLGTSAASRFFWNGTFHHRRQLADFRKYSELAGRPTEWEPNTWAQTVLEAVFLELRKKEGVHLDTFLKRYKWDLRQLTATDLYVRQGLLAIKDGRLFATSKGRLLLDGLAKDLTPDLSLQAPPE